MMQTILICDDEKNILSGLCIAFKDEGYNVLAAEDGKTAWSLLTENIVDLVVTDLRMPGYSGQELLKKITSSYPSLPVIVLTGHGTIESAVESMRDGAVDFFTKPVEIEKLLLVVKKTLEARFLINENKRLLEEIDRIKSEKGLSKIVGRSSKINSLLATIKQVAPTKATVLITGESGTGKELVADAIQNLSNRKDKPFIKVHSASLAPSLLEDELFGHEKGAFTGAMQEKKGRFELADGGTLFLDEIGEIDQAIQIKLLRVLQEKTFERVGGERTINVDVRLLCATNKDLEEEVKKGNFRQDLFYRLNVVNITVPPLRERREDIELLSHYFLSLFNKENEKDIEGFTAAARKKMVSYPWPGNVRELRNAVEAAVVLTRGKTIDVADLPSHVKESDKESEIRIPLPISMDEAEKIIINETISYCKGNKSRAAEILNIGRKTIHRKLKEEDEG